MKTPRAAHEPFRLTPPSFDARCRACWFSVGVLALVIASFWSLDLQWAQLLSLEALRSMGRFGAEFFPADTSFAFLAKVALGTWETLALHTTSVIGRLFAEAVEDAPPGRAAALRTQGVGNVRVFAYATLPQVLPQRMSYTLYRWENNIRAAAVMGLVGAPSYGARRWLTR